MVFFRTFAVKVYTMNKKRKDTEGFWKQYFRRYDVVFTQHGGRDVERRYSTSRFILSLYALALIAVVVTATTLLLFYTPLRALMPGYVSPEARRVMVESSLRLDSLGEAVQRHQLYVMNLQDILRGNVNVDSVSTIDSLTVLRSADLMERTERESEFIRQYEENEKYNLTSQGVRKTDMEGLHFNTPLRGLLLQSFAPTDLHFGVDIATSHTNQNICSVLDGTVLTSSYTATDGYVTVIQHVGNMVTIYKHLTAVLKHEGSKVKAGEAIGVIEQHDKKEQPYLHFELWHKGTPLDPTQYISF